MSKFCKNCGAQLNDAAKFCADCGAKVTDEKPKCAQCGSELNVGAKFCPICGAPTGVQSAQAAQPMHDCDIIGLSSKHRYLRGFRLSPFLSSNIL